MSLTLKPGGPGELQPVQTRPAGRGLLRIYLGYAPGTGKTFAMLSAARGLHDEGRDVMLGLIETRGRKATEALTLGLPVLPPKVVDFGGCDLNELALDAALERQPEVLLVDEQELGIHGKGLTAVGGHAAGDREPRQSFEPTPGEAPRRDRCSPSHRKAPLGTRPVWTRNPD